MNKFLRLGSARSLRFFGFLLPAVLLGISGCQSGADGADASSGDDTVLVGERRASPRPSASPSASPSPKPTISPSPSPTVKPSPSPTATPTSTPTVSPTPTATPTPTASPTSGAGPFTPARTLRVCLSGCTYAKPSEAFAVAQDLDLIEIQAASYTDCGTLKAARLWVRGVGGRPHIRDLSCGGKGLWITQGKDITIENVEFSGMQVPDQNGAGIRHEGEKLTLRNVYMHDGEEGVLAGAGAAREILIENSTFERLGKAGYAHGMYINQIKSFTLRRSIVRESKDEGHEVKSRAYKSTIECNLLVNGNGMDSYTLDLPNGGEAYVKNNLIHQGPMTANSGIMTFGVEGASNPTQKLELTGNILINDRPGGGTFLNLAATNAQVSIQNNLVVGPGTFIGGAGAATAVQSGNTIKGDRATAGITQQYPLPAACGSAAIGASI